MKILSLLLIAAFTIQAQNKVITSELFAPFALTEARNAKESELRGYGRLLNNYKPGITEERVLRHALKELSLALYKDSLLFSGLKGILNKHGENSSQINISVITAAKALYPDKFDSEIITILKKTSDKEVFANAAIYLSRYPQCVNCDTIITLLRKKFPDYNNDEYLSLLTGVLKKENEELSNEDVISILSSEYQREKTVIFSIQRRNRVYPGLTIIRKPNGEFLRDSNGDIFCVKQLALAVGNLPGFMRNGNTPQGIFSVVGFYVSPTPSIGPTPNVLTRIPFGKPPETFFHGLNKYSDWNMEDYANLLPVNLRNNKALYEAFYAGKFGRRLLVMHGSVDNLDYYKNEIYYPLSPTKGCLSTVEIWDSTGKNIRSDQAKLINAFFSTGKIKGFLVVFDIDDKEKPVEVNEIKGLILEAERRMNRDKE